VKRNWLYEGILGGISALVVAGLSYLGFVFAGLPRPELVIFDWLARLLPGDLITLGIDSMVAVISRFNLGPTASVSKAIEMTMAVLLFMLIGAVFAIVLGFIGSRNPHRIVLSGALGGLLLALFVLLIMNTLPLPPAGPLLSALWLGLIFPVWGAVLGRLLRILYAQDIEPEGGLTRRQFLYLVGVGSFSILLTAAGVSILSRDEEELADTGAAGEPGNAEAMANEESTAGPAASPPEEVLADRFPPVQGTREELTSNSNFYRIDINSMPPQIDGDTWQLEVGGLVNNPLILSIDDIRSRPAVSQAITLECISNRLAGDLISTSLWTGVRLRDILEEAGMQSGALEVYIESVDGFYESVPMEEAMDERTLLVYEMNGEPLPVEHGYPLRIYIPDHFGMKQPKWITRMEVINYEGPGYWVERGWSDTAIPPTTSVIDAVATDEFDPEEGFVPVGGIAYAGARGISKVEIQVDNGPWEEAELRQPALSPLTWVQWRYNWPSVPGRHTFRVRAYDGNGDLQETEPSPPHPDGATGVHSVSERIPEA